MISKAGNLIFFLLLYSQRFVEIQIAVLDEYRFVIKKTKKRVVLEIKR